MISKKYVFRRVCCRACVHACVSACALTKHREVGPAIYIYYSGKSHFSEFHTVLIEYEDFIQILRSTSNT